MAAAAATATAATTASKVTHILDANSIIHGHSPHVLDIFSTRAATAAAATAATAVTPILQTTIAIRIFRKDLPT
eukprot:6842457-Karenia_brevis.AAC.1